VEVRELVMAATAAALVRCGYLCAAPLLVDVLLGSWSVVSQGAGRLVSIMCEMHGGGSRAARGRGGTMDEVLAHRFTERGPFKLSLGSQCHIRATSGAVLVRGIDLLSILQLYRLHLCIRLGHSGLCAEYCRC